MRMACAVIRAGRLATVASTPLSLALPWQLPREQPDVVHLHFPYPVGEVSQWLLRRGRATVLSYHSDIVRQAGILRFYRPLLLRVLAAVDAIIIGSPPMRGSAYLTDHQAKLHLIPYGIPLARFKTPPPPMNWHVSSSATCRSPRGNPLRLRQPSCRCCSSLVVCAITRGWTT